MVTLLQVRYELPDSILGKGLVDQSNCLFGNPNPKDCCADEEEECIVVSRSVLFCSVASV